MVVSVHVYSTCTRYTDVKIPLWRLRSWFGNFLIRFLKKEEDKWKKNIGALINDSYFDTGNTALNRVFFLDKSLAFVENVQYLMYTVFLV